MHPLPCVTRHYTPLGELLRGSFEPLHDAFVAAATRAVLAPLEQQRHLAPSLATSLPDGTVKTDPSGSAQTSQDADPNVLRLSGRAWRLWVARHTQGERPSH